MKNKTWKTWKEALKPIVCDKCGRKTRFLWCPSCDEVIPEVLK